MHQWSTNFFFLVCAMRNLCFLLPFDKSEHKVLFLFFVTVFARSAGFSQTKTTKWFTVFAHTIKKYQIRRTLFGAFLKFLCFRVYYSSKVNNQPTNSFRCLLQKNSQTFSTLLLSSKIPSKKKIQKVVHNK